MPTVTDTIEEHIGQMTSRLDELSAEVVRLKADVEEHYAFLGRKYYNERRLARGEPTPAFGRAS